MSGPARYSEPEKGTDGKWYFHLQAANGEIVMQSEGYETEGGAKEGIAAARHAAAEDADGCYPASMEITISGEDRKRHFVEVHPVL